MTTKMSLKESRWLVLISKKSLTQVADAVAAKAQVDRQSSQAAEFHLGKQQKVGQEATIIKADF